MGFSPSNLIGFRHTSWDAGALNRWMDLGGGVLTWNQDNQNDPMLYSPFSPTSGHHWSSLVISHQWSSEGCIAGTNHGGSNLDIRMVVWLLGGVNPCFNMLQSCKDPNWLISFIYFFFRCSVNPAQYSLDWLKGKLQEIPYFMGKSMISGSDFPIFKSSTHWSSAFANSLLPPWPQRKSNPDLTTAILSPNTLGTHRAPRPGWDLQSD